MDRGYDDHPPTAEAKALSKGLSGVVLVEGIKLPVPRRRTDVGRAAFIAMWEDGRLHEAPKPSFFQGMEEQEI